MLRTDTEEFQRITKTRNGYIFVIPIALAGIDVYSTVLNLSLNPNIIELNPFVSAAAQYGAAAIVPFLVSYMLLSQGLALLMLNTGRWLFNEKRSLSLLPFAVVCGISSFGPNSNLLGMEIGYATQTVFVVTSIVSAILSGTIWRIVGSPTALSISSFHQ